MSPAPVLPTVEALAGLWRQVSAKPLWATHLWRYLKLRLRMRTELLSPYGVRLRAPLGKVNDCAACTDICCVGPRSTVLLGLRDLATLMDLKRTDLVTHDKPRFAEEDLATRQSLRRHVGSAAWQVFPVLRQTSAHFCAALTAAGRCSLYPHWPLSCARFPYSLHLDPVEVFYSPRCASFEITAQAEPRIKAMAALAVQSYNERIKDAVLIAFARERLTSLGLTAFLRLDP